MLGCLEKKNLNHSGTVFNVFGSSRKNCVTITNVETVTSDLFRFDLGPGLREIIDKRGNSSDC